MYCPDLARSVLSLLHSLFCLEHLLLVCHCPISCHPIYKCREQVQAAVIKHPVALKRALFLANKQLTVVWMS